MHTLTGKSACHTLFVFFASFRRSKSTLSHLLCETMCSPRTDKQSGTNVTSVDKYSKIVTAQQLGDRIMYIIICYSPAGRSVLGKTVPEVSSTARGRRLRAVLETEGTVFPNTERQRPVNNIFIYFQILNYESKIQTHCVVLFILFVWVIKFAFTLVAFVRIHCFFMRKLNNNTALLQKNN